MPHNSLWPENFDEADQKFDLVRLKRDLEKHKRSDITGASWRYFKGILCLGEPSEVAKKCCITLRTVQVTLNRDIKPYLLNVLIRTEQRIVWSRVAGWLLEVGYGRSESLLVSSQVFDWQKICRQMLDRTKRLSTDRLMARDGIEFAPNKLFVPLGLVERRQKRHLRPDLDSTEQGSLLLQPTETEITQTFEFEEFVATVIGQFQTPKSQGRRLVIVGEPGSGKTTLLQRIGDEVEKAGAVPIWISLADIGEGSLQDYLSKRWLTKASGAIESAPEEWRIAFNDWLKSGQVYLLLDGIDEMSVKDMDAPCLHNLDDSLQEEWVRYCRLQRVNEANSDF